MYQFFFNNIRVSNRNQRDSLVLERSLRAWESQIRFPADSNQRFQIGCSFACLYARNYHTFIYVFRIIYAFFSGQLTILAIFPLEKVTQMYP